MTIRETISDTTRSTVLMTDITDADGEPIGRTVLVGIDYTTEVDLHYGADADGSNGVLRLEYVYQDAYIDPEDLMTMNSHQVEQLIRDAREAFVAHGPRG